MHEVSALNSPTVSTSPLSRSGPLSSWKVMFIAIGTLLVTGVLVWQAITEKGAPNPAAHELSRSAMALSSGVLVFREGLEAILVLAAVTAGLARYKSGFWRPVLLGIGVALLATVATWFVAVAVLSSVNAPELQIQAATGLIAIVVLLVVMNWFFHKLYWTEWICSHCKRRKRLFENPNATKTSVTVGLALLGFTAIYREGFEVVLFLQDLRLKAGSGVVLSGASVGLVLTGIVAVLTFAAHRRLPYKRMLILTGVLLAGVLIVMIGESAQELQEAGWLPTHLLSLPIPEWVGVWFAIFPTLEGLIAQVLAIAVLLGSYAWVRSRVPRADGGEVVTAGCEVNS